MPFRKRETSPVINKALLRLSGMKEIDKNKGKVVDYGGEEKVITSETVETLVKRVTSNTELYNQALQQADSISNLIEVDEEQLNNMLGAVLKSASAKFGDDSNEVEKLGGTRKSDRKKFTRTAKAV